MTRHEVHQIHQKSARKVSRAEALANDMDAMLQSVGSGALAISLNVDTARKVINALLAQEVTKGGAA